jgi:hypothetical protein
MKVQSSTIDEVLYDGKDMTITFTSGSTYVYSNVPNEVYTDFVNADSKGRYFHNNIKESYICTRLK